VDAVSTFNLHRAERHASQAVFGTALWLVRRYVLAAYWVGDACRRIGGAR